MHILCNTDRFAFAILNVILTHTHTHTIKSEQPKSQVNLRAKRAFTGMCESNVQSNVLSNNTH